MTEEPPESWDFIWTGALYLAGVVGFLFLAIALAVAAVSFYGLRPFN